MIYEYAKAKKQIIPNANFKYPKEDCLDYNVMVGILGVPEREKEEL